MQRIIGIDIGLRFTGYGIVDFIGQKELIVEGGVIKTDSSDEKQVKKSEIFKYPNGRLIIYSNNQILEDKPLDYPFGFPFQTFTPTPSDRLVGYGDVEDLMQIQARLCDAYLKLTTLLNKYKSWDQLSRLF